MSISYKIKKKTEEILSGRDGTSPRAIQTYIINDNSKPTMLGTIFRVGVVSLLLQLCSEPTNKGNLIYYMI